MLPIEQAAVAAAHDAEVLGRRHLALDQVLGHGDEVLVGLVAVLLQRRLVPLRAELAAAADVGDDDTRRPSPATPRRPVPAVAGRQRDLEAAVAVEQRRVRAVQSAGPLRDTWKYGILVPSFDVASCWLTVKPFGVEERGRCLSFSGWPLADRADTRASTGVR